jgi:hypothetical protein
MHLQGLKFEAIERYEGLLDRNKLKNGKGSLYYKAEGYHAQEKLLYRGHFKEGVYQGYGLLNWEGSEKHRYVGRFKAGQMHGKGIEFDKHGNKIYQGTYREDQREGLSEWICLSIYLTIYPFIYLIIYLSIYLSIKSSI